LVSQTCWIGSAMPHYEYMHQPGVDKLFKNIDQLVTIKQLTSVTEQLNKERALSECFAGLGHDSGFSMRKWIADWQAINGINYINPHLSLYSMRGERKRDYPPNLFYQQPWWDEEKLFSDYASRLNIIASTGKRSVRVLVLHTISSVWAEFNPCERDKGYPSAACYDKEFDVLAMQLQANRIDFHFGDETILAKHAHVVDGKISIGDYLYDTVILPPALTFKCSTIELLEAVQDSIELFSLGRKYDRVDGIKSEKSIKYSKCFENTNELMVHMIESGYSEIDVKSIVTNISNPKVIASIRDDEDGAFVLISNSDRIECSDTIITIKRSGIPLLFSISKGSVAAIPYLLIDGNIQIRAELFESGSIALFIAKDEITALKYCSNLTAASVISSDGAVINGDVIFKPMCTLNNFVATILDNNILPLSIVKFWVKGELIMENAHLSKIWHYHYYKLLDGTPFSAEYAFEVIEIPSGDIFAAIESAENLDRITLNGIEVKSLRSKGELQVFDDKAFIDVSFSKVNLTGKLVKGTNILRIEGMKINNVIGVGSHVTVDDHENYFPTELETIYIEGKFKVSDIDSKDFFIDAYNDYVNPSDITKNGYPFYAGRISYSLKAKLPSSSTVLLYLSDLCGTSASLYFGSRKICSAGWAPYVFDVTEFAGEELEFKLIITNDLYNLMGPVYIKNLDSEPWVNPGIFNDYSRYTKKSNLKSFGLGSVVVLGG